MLSNLTKSLCKKSSFAISPFKPAYLFSNCSHQTVSTDTEVISEPFETYRKEELKRLYHSSYETKIPGSATSEATKKYSLRNNKIGERHFRKPYRADLTLSSIGLGTYVGAPDEIDDLKMFNGMIESVVSGGVNVIDTAINYRFQKSERVVGAALRYLIEKGFSREELFICSKNGYIPEDADKGIPSSLFVNSLIQQGKITQDDVVGEAHCIHPNFLEDQLEKTLSNIGLEKLDLYYLHNAAEAQLPLIGHEKFIERMTRAFEFCEEKVCQGKIGAYGLATWMCFRAKPDEEKIYLRLQEMVELAQKVGGENHNLKYVQLPVSMIMPEAFAHKWQEVKEENQTIEQNLFQVARKMKVSVITSSSLAQGQLSQLEPPTDVFKMSTRAAKHLQFTRSIPAEALLSTLVGQKTKSHVKDNLEVIEKPPLPMDEWFEFFKAASEK